MRDGINPQMQLAPSPGRRNAVCLIEPFSLALVRIRDEAQNDPSPELL